MANEILLVPVRSPFKISSPFGVARVLPNGARDVHDGIDFISEVSNEVFSASDGMVVFDKDDYDERKRWQTGKGHTAGNMVIVTSVLNGVTYHFRYLHLGENFVSKGGVIKAGQLIGMYADVGFSFGAHLHFDCFEKFWRLPKIDTTPLFDNFRRHA